MGGLALLALAAAIAYLGPEHQSDHPSRDSLSDDDTSRTQKLAPEHGRLASTPTHIPMRGWKDILWRTYEQVGEDRLLAVAAGVVLRLASAFSGDHGVGLVLRVVCRSAIDQ